MSYWASSYWSAAYWGPYWGVREPATQITGSGAGFAPAAEGSGAGSVTIPVLPGGGGLFRPARLLVIAKVRISGSGRAVAPAAFGRGAGAVVAPVRRGLARVSDAVDERDVLDIIGLLEEGDMDPSAYRFIPVDRTTDGHAASWIARPLDPIEQWVLAALEQQVRPRIDENASDTGELRIMWRRDQLPALLDPALILRQLNTRAAEYNARRRRGTVAISLMDSPPPASTSGTTTGTAPPATPRDGRQVGFRHGGDGE